MIEVVDVWHHYGRKPVLRDVSLTVQQGELVAVMGPNGMGKSTLLALIGGLLWPLRGYVAIDGHKRRNSIEEELEIRRKVLYQPADPFLPPLITGRQYILATGRLYDVDERRLMDHTQQLLTLFDLAEHADSQISSYSTGQRRKAALCAALATEAPILILDEPFSGGLDSAALFALSKVLKQLADRQDITVLMAVPVPELVEPIAHRIAVIADGRITACDTVDGLRRQTGCSGSLAEVLESLLHPDVLNSVDTYLEARQR